MFSDVNFNIIMLEGAYKKIKSYYHYNKNFVFMKQKVAQFEYDEGCMRETINMLAELLANPNKSANRKKISDWINDIDVYIMPKSFVNKEEKSDMFVTSSLPDNKPINKVNFFIDMNMQLHLLETLWTILIGKIIMEKGAITNDCYGNCLDNQVLYNKQEDYLHSINFSKNKMFSIYFNKYCEWKNGAIKAAKTASGKKKDSLLFSLDIKSYFYSVRWNFKELYTFLDNDTRLNSIMILTKIIEKIYAKYTDILSLYREDLQMNKKNEYILPIGLFSSMVIANIYLSSFDKQMRDNPEVLFYGRYVDDLLILIDVTMDANNISEKTAIDTYLVKKYPVLEKGTEKKYVIAGYPTLKIQENKVKMIYFEHKSAKAIIGRFKEMLEPPSQMNIIPDSKLKFPDLEEAAYVIKNFNRETKIRDVGQVEIDRFQLGWHMSQLVLNNRSRKEFLSLEEKIERYNEGLNILEFFRGSKALEYNSNWVNVLYYFLLTSDSNKSAWKEFEANARTAIKQIKIEQLEDIKKEKRREVKKKLQQDLYRHFDICVAIALALNLNFSKKEKANIIELAKQIRKANLFNHHLVAYPLINYADELDDECDLTRVKPEDIRRMKLSIKFSRKSKLSPRFIFIDEIFQFVFLKQVTRGGNYYLDTEKGGAEQKIKYIQDYFYEVNNIHYDPQKALEIVIKNEELYGGYVVQRIKLGKNNISKKIVRIAIANVRLNTRRCCFGLEDMGMIDLNRPDFLKFMEEAYSRNNNPVDFLLLPEFYLPLQWISDVLTFVRNTGITVISGLQYITCDDQAYNNVAVFTAVKSGKYRNAIMLVREKNDYAPMEKELLAIKKYCCKDQEKPNYQIISSEGIDYGIFLCYEFTDIVARSLYKNQVDILFAPEHNKDTSYFSSIIETTTRDLHTFIVQSNTSIYGDSRIVGPYGKNDRNVVQIKGGDCDDIIVGTIELEKVREYQQNVKREARERIEEYLKLGKAERYKKEQEIFKQKEIKIAKTSARFKARYLEEN